MTDPQDLMQQIASAGARVDSGLSDDDLDRLIDRANQLRRRRIVRRTVLLGAAASSIVALSCGWWLSNRPAVMTQPESVASGKPTSAPVAADRTVRLLDGSTATPLDSRSEIVVLGQSPTRVALSLAHGSGRFEITPRPDRSLTVRAGEVTVRVIGTAFTVERIADRVGVAVERGTVQVEWAAGLRLLGKGESGWFPPLGVQPAPKPTARLAPNVATGMKAKLDQPAAVPESPPPRPLRENSTIEQGESLGQMLRAADAERAAGRPMQAAELLRKTLREHQNDPRAPLAAFTLGRVLLMELGQPREAAAAFAEVRRLSPGGAFAEDALAREVEAWGRAGQRDLGRERATEYLRLYPGGRRADAVRAFIDRE